MWPRQSECDAFYGNPRGPNGRANQRWETANLVNMKTVFRMTHAGQQVKTLRVHRLVAGSLTQAFTNIWLSAGRDQDKVDAWGASIYGGAYNYRLMRGSNHLSIHSYGAAIDLDPARNGFHDKTPNFRNVPAVLEAFGDEKWTWGGKWTDSDGMHFQAARVK